MYSCVFWYEFIDLVGFFGSCCLTPVTLFIIRSKGSTEKQPAVRTLSTRRRFATQKLNPSNHRFFRPEVNFYFYFIPKCCLYTCQLFLRCRREIFILGVLGFLKTTRSFPKISEEVRSLPKTSEVFRRRPKSAEGEVIEKTLIHKDRRSLITSAL